MIKLKKILKESYVWERKFGESLPTLEDVTNKHQQNAIHEIANINLNNISYKIEAAGGNVVITGDGITTKWSLEKSGWPNIPLVVNSIVQGQKKNDKGQMIKGLLISVTGSFLGVEKTKTDVLPKKGQLKVINGIISAPNVGDEFDVVGEENTIIFTRVS